MIVVEQRTHENDTSGHLLKLEPGDWTHIKLPMEAEEDERWVFPISGRVVERKKGELLWAERFPCEVVQFLRRRLGARAYSAQYQQRPAPAEGIIFNPNHWRYFVLDPTKAHDDVQPAPSFDEVAVSADCAFKSAEDNDTVSIGALGFAGPRTYLLDKETDHMGYTLTKLKIRAMRAKHRKVSAILIEDKANGSAVIEELSRETLGAGVIPIDPEGGKIARAWACQPDQEAGNCYLPEDAPWTPAFVELMSQFPSVEFDDDVDMFTQAVNWRRMRSHGLLELYREQYEKIKAGEKRSEPGTPEQQFQIQADAQMEQARKADFKVAGVFGAQVNKVASSSAPKPKVVAQTPKCPKCGNVNISRARVGGISGDVEEKCGACGWNQILPGI
jgi:predicted phage terminase large subunit-like protein